ncbi:muts domain V-domain-containing protein [Entophlyctis helioformis]|nr:muts domain V-domain-containing protein [Entophlyctis helioformis]
MVQKENVDANMKRAATPKTPASAPAKGGKGGRQMTLMSFLSPQPPRPLSVAGSGSAGLPSNPFSQAAASGTAPAPVAAMELPSEAAVDVASPFWASSTPSSDPARPAAASASSYSAAAKGSASMSAAGQESALATPTHTLSQGLSSNPSPFGQSQSMNMRQATPLGSSSSMVSSIAVTPVPTYGSAPAFVAALAETPDATLPIGRSAIKRLNQDGHDSDHEEMPSSQRRQRPRRTICDDDEDDDPDYQEEDAAMCQTSRPQTPLARSMDDDNRVASYSQTPSQMHTPKRASTPTTPKTPTTGQSGYSTSSPHNSLSGFSMTSTSTVRKGQSFTPTSAEKKKARAESFKEKNELRYSWLLEIRDADGRPKEDPEYDPRTLFIPTSAWRNFTPFEKQFWEIKSKHWDTVVFFKKGKFFELYEKDADIGHQVFDLKLTDRVNMRMVGVPESSFDHWAAQFIAKGYKVAKVEQMENAVGKAMRDRESASKEDKIIRRELTSVLTAGTLVDAGLLTNDMSTYCMAIKEEIRADHLPPSFGVSFVDTAMAEFSICSFADDAERTKLETLLMQIKPIEIVLEKGMVSKATLRLLKNSLENPQLNFLVRDKEFWDEDVTKDELRRGSYFGDKAKQRADSGAGDDQDGDHLMDGSETDAISSWPAALQSAASKPLAMSSLGGLLFYLRSLKLDVDLVSARNFRFYDPMRSSGTLILDGQTLLNLEIFENSTDGTDRGALFKLLNQCETPFGKRLFKQWLCHPLRSVDALNARLDAVDAFASVSGMLDVLRSKFRKLPDLERTVARIHSGSCRVKDFVVALLSIADIFELVSDMQPYLSEVTSAKLIGIFQTGFPLDLLDLLEYFRNAFNYREAMDEGKIRLHPGYDDVFDAAEQAVADVEAKLTSHRRECERKLNVSGLAYKDIGKEIYQLEVSAKIKVPSDWTVMSKTQAVSRYYNATIRSLVGELLEAREVREAAMRNIKSRIYEKFDTRYTGWMTVIKSVAELDALMSLATCRNSMPEPVCRPEFVESEQSVLDVEELRHPCIMQMSGSSFIPNDTKLGGEPGHSKMILLTGPNMGGKSTLLRQTCVAVIMAQLGCYVPARKCRLTPFDRIFTRIGANDNIMAGQSTFMVELSETSKILREATHRSLVILDELGRGTSTYDGYAIAFAVLHHLVTHVGCLGLFSTHYGTLTKEFEDNPIVALKYMSFFSDEVNRRVTFLYKLTDGNCPKSYGMNVARMADVPLMIVDRAESVAESFERDQKHQLQEQQQVRTLGLGHLASFAQIVKQAAACTGSMSAKDTEVLAAHCLALSGFRA